MSIEFEELEEPLSRVGALIFFAAGIILAIFAMLGLPILSGEMMYGTSSLAIGYSFLFILIIAILIVFFGFLSFARPWLKYKINVFGAAILVLALNIILILSIPELPDQGETASSAMQIFIWIGLVGVSMVFVSKRPNLGKESNKHIYQAYGAVLEFVVAIFLLGLGLYILYFDVSQFAGNGTFPGGFVSTYIKETSKAETTYNQIRYSGIIIIIGAIIIMVASLIRNLISLKISAGVIIVGIIVCLVGLSYFSQNWQALDTIFREEDEYKDVYTSQLKLSDPGVMDLGIVLILLQFIGLIMIIYASTQSEPLEKWRTARNHSLAAAEVAIKDQKLSKAIKYLERASVLSSKLGEEDKSVELITRINNIKEKAIKMRKAEAAEKKKRELEKAKEKAKKKAPKAPKKEEKE